MARWFGTRRLLLVDSELLTLGTDVLSGTVTTRQDIPLEDAILAFGKQVYLLGQPRTPPSATIRVSWLRAEQRPLSVWAPEIENQQLPSRISLLES